MPKFQLILLSALLAGEYSFAQEEARGQETYLRYCAACHGPEAKGGGPMAAILTLAPTNLTTLATRNGGEFPTVRVVMRIDGREPLVSHGSPMPIYGEFFEGEDTAIKAANGMPILTSRPVVDLVIWLQSIQD